MRRAGTRQRQVVTAPLELRAIDLQSGEFIGLASVWGVVDWYDSAFQKGAFTKTLKEQKRGPGEVPIVHFHDPTRGIGMAHLEETDEGLLANPGRLNINRSEVAREVFAGLPHENEPATGYYADMSHYFIEVRSRPGDKEKGEADLIFTEVEIMEVTIATTNFGANPEADVLAVRAMCQRTQAIGDAIQGREWGKIPDGVRGLLDGIAGLLGEKEEQQDELYVTREM
ncbi:unnamed protein product, partial [marine sediment metagenome]